MSEQTFRLSIYDKNWRSSEQCPFIDEGSLFYKGMELPMGAFSAPGNPKGQVDFIVGQSAADTFSVTYSARPPKGLAVFIDKLGWYRVHSDMDWPDDLMTASASAQPVILMPLDEAPDLEESGLRVVAGRAKPEDMHKYAEIALAGLKNAIPPMIPHMIIHSAFGYGHGTENMTKMLDKNFGNIKGQIDKIKGDSEVDNARRLNFIEMLVKAFNGQAKTPDVISLPSFGASGFEHNHQHEVGGEQYPYKADIKVIGGITARLVEQQVAAPEANMKFFGPALAVNLSPRTMGGVPRVLVHIKPTQRILLFFAMSSAPEVPIGAITVMADSRGTTQANGFGRVPKLSTMNYDQSALGILLKAGNAAIKAAEPRPGG